MHAAAVYSADTYARKYALHPAGRLLFIYSTIRLRPLRYTLRIYKRYVADKVARSRVLPLYPPDKTASVNVASYVWECFMWHDNTRLMLK